MAVGTSRSQENTKICSICGKPLKRWEDRFHISCYQEQYKADNTLDRIGVPLLHQKVIRSGAVQLPSPNLINLLITGQGQGILFTGEAGTGKTLLSCYIASEYVNRTGNSAKYINVPTLLHEIKESFRYNESIPPTRYNGTDLLILDDIGAENTTEWTNEILYLIINKRYVEGKGLIVTTNLSVQALARSIGDRIVSRVVSMCKKVDLGSSDRRLDKISDTYNGQAGTQ